MPNTDLLTRLVPIALAVLSQACAGAAPGTQPHDMSVAHHEAAAAEEEKAASAHTAQYDPGAATSVEKCRARQTKGLGEPICWTSYTNPTARHNSDAAEHKRAAEQHRAAAEALRQAEAKACAGVAPEDRDTSPFYHREDIVRVDPLKDEPRPRGPGFTTLKGATISFRAVPGLTAEWLQRVVDCHIARNAAMGHNAPEMAYCPLVLKDVTASVTSTGDGFAITVSSTDPKTAEEILRRANALMSR